MGAAGAGSDYEKIENRTVLFAPGQSMQYVEIGITNNDRWEPTEFFNVRIHDPVGIRLGPVTAATVTIVDDDSYPGGVKKVGWALMRCASPVLCVSVDFFRADSSCAQGFLERADRGARAKILENNILYDLHGSFPCD